MQQLGVGLLWQAELAPLCRDRDLVQVIELEPEAHWQASSEGYFSRLAAEVGDLAQPKIFHGLGAPVGSAKPPGQAHRAAFFADVRALKPVWVGEHLAFRYGGGDCGPLFLPAAQTPNAIALAANNLRTRRLEIGVPIAFETPINYLRPRAGDLADGAFLAATAAAADCGIVLDLHSLWCNARNGRAALGEVLAALPLDRVWELQLAGGSRIAGYWTDRRPGPIDEALLALAEALIPRLVNLSAIIWEVSPLQVAPLGLDGIARQLERLHRLWQARPAGQRASKRARSGGLPGNGLNFVRPEEWETVLGSLASGEEVIGPLADQLSADPALPLYRLLSQSGATEAFGAALRPKTPTALYQSASSGT